MKRRAFTGLQLQAYLVLLQEVGIQAHDPGDICMLMRFLRGAATV